jgi:hypothetical protein
MGREPEFHFEFPKRFEIRTLERLRPRPYDEGYTRSLGFPGGRELDPQQELADPPILAVRPTEGEAWIGTFRGEGYGAPPAAPTQVVGMPDELSICVVKHGAAYVVRTDDPSVNLALDLFPVCDVLSIREQGLVIFGDFIRLVAYGENGVVWRSERLVLDDLKIVRAEGEVLHLSGSGIDSRTDFTVDLRSGQSPDQLFSEAWGR